MDTSANPARRAEGLRAATSAAHGRLDHRIVAADPFGSRKAYARFLMVQHAFHADIDALYRNGKLKRVLPDLEERRRLHQIESDLEDLGITVPRTVGAPAFPERSDLSVPTALGWLYVAEGSNLGAAFLLKEAVKLGLSETHGARHLAGAPEGRGLHWRTFTAALDAVPLSRVEEALVVAGAEAAFARVYQLVELHLPVSMTPAEATHPSA